MGFSHLPRWSTTGKTREFLSADFRASVPEDPLEALADDDSFLDNGIIDSTGILELIMFLEEHYGISVTDEEMLPENLDSVVNLVRFVERKRS